MNIPRHALNGDADVAILDMGYARLIGDLLWHCSGPAPGHILPIESASLCFSTLSPRLRTEAPPSPFYPMGSFKQTDVVWYLVGRVPGILQVADKKGLKPLDYAETGICKEFIQGAMRAEKQYAAILPGECDPKSTPLRSTFTSMLKRVRDPLAPSSSSCCCCCLFDCMI